MLEFKDIEIGDKALFDKYTRNDFGVEACFGNMYLWRESWHIMISHDSEALYILLENGDCPSFMLPPFMKDETTSMCGPIKKCEEYLREVYNKPLLFKAATTKVMQRIERDCPGQFVFMEDRVNFEYVYSRDELANLPGKRFHKKRNHINKLLMQHEFEYRPYDSGYYDECIALQEAWIDTKGGLNEDFADELFVTKEALSNLEELDLRCGLLFIDGNMEAFSIGEKFFNMAVIHIEKANPEIPGVFNLINREFVRNAWEDVEFINREEDMGLEGLRKSKMSYRPVFFIEKFDCVRK